MMGLVSISGGGEARARSTCIGSGGERLETIALAISDGIDDALHVLLHCPMFVRADIEFSRRRSHFEVDNSFLREGLNDLSCEQ